MIANSLAVRMNNHECHRIDADAAWQSPQELVFTQGGVITDEDEFDMDEVWWSLALIHLRQAIQLHREYISVTTI